MREECGYGTGGIVLSFLLGGIVGAGFALLLAPQSGRETRQKIRELTEDVKGKTMDYVEEVKGKVTGGLDKGKEFYEDKKTMVTSAIEAGKEAYEREKERLSKEPNA
jgi:gas vesicle protein